MTMTTTMMMTTTTMRRRLSQAQLLLQSSVRHAHCTSLVLVCGGYHSRFPTRLFIFSNSILSKPHDTR